MKASFDTARVRANSASRRAIRAAEQTLRDKHFLPGEPPPRGVFVGLPASAPPGVSIVPAPVPAPSSYPPAKTIGVENEQLQRASRQGPPERRVYVARLHGGRVAGTAGIAITADGEVLADTAWDDEQLRRTGLVSGHRLPRITHERGRLVSLVTLWSENYFHWLLDALPRLSVLAAAGEPPTPLLVPERLPRFASETLDLLGLPAGARVPHRHEHVVADDLVWPSPAGHTGHPAPFAVAWLRERLRTATQASTGGRRRLYVTRTGVARGWPRRLVVNEREVLQLLKPLGFETVRPERLTVAEQIRLFAEAETVLGPHGGSSANTMFADSLTVIELFEPAFVNTCGHALASACGHDYWYLMCEARTVGDLWVPLSELEQTLLAAGIT